MVVASMVVSVVVIFGGLFLVSRSLRRRRAQPSAEFAGAPIAFGTVTGLQNTHRGYNGAMYYDVTLDVRCPDGERFPAVTRQLMYGGRKASFQPGAVWPVRFRPGEPGRIELVQDQSDPQTEGQVQAAWSALQGPGNRPGL